MNDFLTQIKNIIKNNPQILNYDLHNFLYTQLISYDLGKSEPFKDMSFLFDKWIDRNKNNNNLETFVSKSHPYFCQFINKEATNIAEEAIKLYIPLDEEHLYEGANILFDFIANNKIKHNSKIGKKIRNDNIVVRVSNIEEAEKVIDFVKNNSYLQEGLIHTNPFVINVDGVGIAKDGMRSYNSELCNFLEMFINILVKHNRLDNLNINTFHEYLEHMKDRGDKDLQLINSIQRVVTSEKKLDFNDFKDIINNKFNEEKNVDKESIFKNSIITTYNLYGLQHTIAAIAAFRYNGNVSGFTRTGGARLQLILNKITMDDVNNFLINFNAKDGNIIEDYIYNALDFKTKDVFDYIVNAYKETYKRYGEFQANIAIREYIVNGKTNYITNSNNARDNLKKYVDFSKSYDIIRERLNISTFCSLEELSEEFIKEINVKEINFIH